jgi:hypothetical protein
MLATDRFDTNATAPPLGANLGATLAPTRSNLRDLLWAFADGEAAAHRHLLVLRFAVLNLVAAALLAAAWLKGWVRLVLAGDETRLVVLIALVFAAGLFECARQLWQTSAELDQIATDGRADGDRVSTGPLRRYLDTIRVVDGHDRAIAGAALKLRLAARIAPVRHVANSLVFLGLIGTVIGFIVALSGVDPDAAADVSAIGPMVSTLIGGMSVALYTTLVGAVLNIWLMVNYRLLEGGTVRLLTATVERGVRHV